jgi:hypothetical protein
MSQINKCSPCGAEFNSEVEYLEHQCPKAGNAKPTSPDFLKNTTMPNFEQVSEAALKRGEEK